MVMAALAGCTSGMSDSGRHAPGVGCTTREVSRDTLVVEGGREFYVGVTTMAHSRGEVLIAGWPAYLSGRSDDGRPIRTPADSILGVIFSSGRPATTIRTPSDAHTIGGVRALARPDGAWDVVFADLSSTAPEGAAQRDTASRLWYGVYDGRRWKSLEEIPTPGGFTIHPLKGTQLVRSGDVLSWAVRTTRPGYHPDVLVFHRKDGAWLSETVGVPATAYIEMAHLGGAGPVLAAVHGDTSIRTGDTNSLFLYSRDSVWRGVGRVALGGAAPVHHPSLHTDSGAVLTWYVHTPAGNQVRVARSPAETPSNEVSVLDSAYSGGRAVVSMRLAAGSVWVVNHRAAGRERAQLRFLRRAGRQANEVARWESPFESNIRGIPTGDSDMLLAGGSIRTRDSIPISLLVRVRLNCGK
ncbi:MAG TPA: hypothetical protein VGB24_09985 [Longimicrobium sp.]|uniref:hypothetical protein n=1 Tax=Longimicrobium sp. TaxID=2029185 RepID=UPI002ED9DD3D